MVIPIFPDVKVVERAIKTSFLGRKLVLEMTSRAKASHIGSCLSVIDILANLYSGSADISFETADSTERDRIILSKGHAAAALYSVLALKGFMPESSLSEYCLDGSPLSGHATHKQNIGVELSTGSLGHGLPYGAGIALGLKHQENFVNRVFVIISDGECDEGTTWETALIAAQFRLDNLIVIIDRNRIQSLDDTEKTIALEPLAEKWWAFNWDVVEVDGHDHNEMYSAFVLKSAKPRCIIANTTKGKGISFMENSVLWHYKSPSEAELAESILELENNA